MGTGLEAQQAVKQVVPLPRPQPHVPRVDVAPGASGSRPKHARAMAVRQRERPFQLRTLEILRTMTLHDAERARVLGERGRIGQYAVHHEPLVGGQSAQPPPPQPPPKAGPSLCPPNPPARTTPSGLPPSSARTPDHPHAVRS